MFTIMQQVWHKPTRVQGAEPMDVADVASSGSTPNNQHKPELLEKHPEAGVCDSSAALKPVNERGGSGDDHAEEEEEEEDVLLSSLPKELVIEIFGSCSMKDLCVARGVSKSWCRLIQSDAVLWRRIGRRDLALTDIEEFMTPRELELVAARRQDENGINWVDIYKRVYGCGWEETPQIGTSLLDNGRTISYMPGDVGYRCFISKKAFDKGRHYIEVHFRLLKEGFYKGTIDSNTYGFGFGNRTIYTINSGSSYLPCNNGRGWYDNGNAYNIQDESTALVFPKWGEKDTLGVLLDFDENQAAFFKNRERVTKYFKVYSHLPSGSNQNSGGQPAGPPAAEPSATPNTGSSLSTSPPGGIHVVVLTARGGEFTLRYCGSNPPLDVAVSLVDTEEG